MRWRDSLLGRRLGVRLPIIQEPVGTESLALPHWAAAAALIKGVKLAIKNGPHAIAWTRADQVKAEILDLLPNDWRNLFSHTISPLRERHSSCAYPEFRRCPRSGSR